jgi:hypothetical protein
MRLEVLNEILVDDRLPADPPWRSASMIVATRHTAKSPRPSRPRPGGRRRHLAPCPLPRVTEAVAIKPPEPRRERSHGDMLLIEPVTSTQRFMQSDDARVAPIR